LRERLDEKFNRCAESPQFLVEAIVGMQTIKAEPMVFKQWEERLAAYVRSGAVAVATVAGFSAGAGVYRAAGRYSQFSRRADPGPARPASPARKSRIPHCVLPLSPRRATGGLSRRSVGKEAHR